MLLEAQAILLIREIYLAETPLKSLSPEERLLQRKEKVLPKVNALNVRVFKAGLRTCMKKEHSAQKKQADESISGEQGAIICF